MKIQIEVCLQRLAAGSVSTREAHPAEHPVSLRNASGVFGFPTFSHLSMCPIVMVAMSSYIIIYIIFLKIELFFHLDEVSLILKSDICEIRGWRYYIFLSNVD